MEEYKKKRKQITVLFESSLKKKPMNEFELNEEVQVLLVSNVFEATTATDRLVSRLHSKVIEYNFN